MQKIFDAGSRILIILYLILSQITFFIPITIIPITMASVPPQQWDFHQGNWTYVSKPGFPVNHMLQTRMTLSLRWLGKL